VNTSAAPPRSAPSAGGSWLNTRKGPDTGSRLLSGRRRSIPHLLVGALLVLACAAGVVLWSLVAGERQRVLALARPVSVGHALSAADLREVSVAADAGVSTVAASQASTVIGRVMATSLPAGSLLTPEVLGAALVPGHGQAIAALALKAGAFPPELAPGARVAVVFVPASTAGLPSALASPNVSSWQATVTSVTGRADEQTTVVSLQLAEAAARQVAAVPVGQLSVVMLPEGGQ
ncbi:MAG: SAF domain-containing protein, partial [Pseudonocardiaceae bacterium]